MSLLAVARRALRDQRGEREGDRLGDLYDRLSPADRARLYAGTRDPLADLVLAAVACAPEPVAWRLHSVRLACELWLVRDAPAEAALIAEGVVAGLPVVSAEELAVLRTLDDEALRAALEAKRTFGPGTRVVPGGTDA